MLYKTLTIGVVSIAFTACGDQIVSSCDGVTITPRVDITGANLDTFTTTQEAVPDTKIEGETYIENTPSDYDSVILSITRRYEEIASHGSSPLNLSFSLFNNTYACLTPINRTDETIIDINITSSSDFNDELTVGESLNTKFEVIYTTHYSSYYDYIGDMVQFYDINTFIDQNYISADQDIQLRLNETPQYSDAHNFTITISLDTGEVFELTTPEISFTE